MGKERKFALVKHFSFDSETPVILFATEKEAIAELKRQFENEVRIDTEENGHGGADYEAEITEDGTFAQIRILYTDEVADVTTWHVDSVRN